MAKTKAQIIAEAQVVKNATEVGENTATRVGTVLEDLADADSVVIIPVTGTSSGGSITLSSNPFTQVQTTVNAGQHAIVRVTIGNDVVDFSMNTYSDSVSTYIGASKFLQQELQMTCTASGTVIETINTSNTFSTGESVPNVGIDAVPTQGSDNLVKSGGVADVLSNIIGSNDSIIDISQQQPYKGVLGTADSTYTGMDETKYVHKYVEVNSGDKFVLANNSTGITVYAFVKSTGITGDTVDLCEGERRNAILVGQTTDVITAPSDAVYLCVNTLYNGQDRTPSITRKGVNGVIGDIQESISAVSNEVETLSESVDNSVSLFPAEYTTEQQEQALKNVGIESPAELTDLFRDSQSTIEETISPDSVLQNYFIPSSGTLTSYSGYNVIFYNVRNLTNVKLQITADNTSDSPRAYAFYDGNTASAVKIGNVGPQMSHPATYELDVPAGASYIGCTVNVSRHGAVTAKTQKTVVSGTKMSALINAVEQLSACGLYKDGENYYHFTGSIIRLFKREGPNNLFCLSAIYIGSVTESGVSILNTIQVCGTDNVGPISIFNTNLFPGVYGQWSGGYHGTENEGYPTAKQDSLSIFVDNAEITEDGLYYGRVHFKVTNSLYFPQSVDSSDLSGATKAITELRDYYLDSVMIVKVKMKVVTPVRVSAYYGMQAVSVGFENISLLNNGKEFKVSDLSEVYYVPKPERGMLMQNANGNLHYDLYLKDVGLGMFDSNSERFGFFYPNRNKVYYYLIDGHSSAPTVDAGTIFGWEGIYDLYFD